MQLPTSTEPITTGFSDFDTLLDANGILTGNVCTIRSDPNASGYEFLISIVQANLNNAHFVTTARSKSAIRDSFRRMGGNVIESSSIIDLSDGATGADLLELAGDRSIDRRDILFIDTLNDIEQGDERTYAELYRELQQFAIENEVVVFCHYLSESNESNSLPPVVDYLTDFLLSITVTMSEEGLKQQLWIERLPVGEGLKESQQDTRLISINSSTDQLSLNTGGRI